MKNKYYLDVSLGDLFQFLKVIKFFLDQIQDCCIKQPIR